MTNITIYKRGDLNIGFKVFGHSGYDESGKDIVCAGISALTINFINSVEEFMDDRFVVNTEIPAQTISFPDCSYPECPETLNPVKISFCL